MHPLCCWSLSDNFCASGFYIAPRASHALRGSGRRAPREVLGPLHLTRLSDLATISLVAHSQSKLYFARMYQHSKNHAVLTHFVEITSRNIAAGHLQLSATSLQRAGSAHKGGNSVYSRQSIRPLESIINDSTGPKYISHLWLVWLTHLAPAVQLHTYYQYPSLHLAWSAPVCSSLTIFTGSIHCSCR